MNDYDCKVKNFHDYKVKKGFIGMIEFLLWKPLYNKPDTLGSIHTRYMTVERLLGDS